MAATSLMAPGSWSWRADLWQRARRLFWLKAVGTTAYTWIFFIGYFHLLRNPTQAPVQMPLTLLDRLMPFQPHMLWAYLSLWVYVGLAPAFQKNFTELVMYGIWVGLLCLTGLGIFYLWPTAVAPLTIDVSGYAGFQILRGVDAAGNACPSMHVASAIFTVIRLERVLVDSRSPALLRLLNIGWFLAIVWSTMAIRQHVALDVLAGGLLGLAFALASMRWPRLSPAPSC